jgi:membrane associated rhomboid family serine protease/Flp pilus assembly protein TadD
MRTCQNCGSSYPEDRLYCPECGTAATPAESTVLVQDQADSDVHEVAEQPPARVRIRPGKATLTIVALNVIMFVITVIASKALMNPGVDVLRRLGANFGPKTLDGEWWRLLTSTFLHGGAPHLVFNMWALLNLGILAELLFRRRNFLAIYFLSGVGGSVASLIWHPEVTGVGASGAIFGVAGSMIPAIYLHRLPEVRQILRRDLTSISMFVGFNLIAGFFIPHIDNSAHLGGLIVGTLLGLLLHVRTAENPKSHSSRDYAAIGVMAMVVLSGAVFAARKYEGLPARVRAHDLSNRGNHQAAIAELKKAVEKNGKDSEAFYLLGSEYIDINQNDLALTAFQKVINLSPQNGRGYMGTCIVHMRKREFQVAASQCRKAAELESKNAEVQFNFGLALFAAGEPRSAVAPLQTAIKLRKRYAEAHYILGGVYLENQQFQYAVDELKTAIAIRPEYSEARMALAQAYNRLGMTREADAVLRAAPRPKAQ